jgi:hypothetical protein
MMTPIHKYTGQDLLWTPSAASRQQYELLAGDTVLAMLDMSNWALAAQASIAEGKYSIKQEGFFRQQIMIRANEAGSILATYTRGWGGGTLQVADGHLFKWENVNFWGTKKAWKTSSGTCLVQFQNSPWTRDLLIRVEPEAVTTPEHPLLVIMSLYISIFSKRDVAMPAHIL